ncbi:MAG: hypothetical protein Q9163_003902 [Psora crenata]
MTPSPAHEASGRSKANDDLSPPTIAAFSPNQPSSSPTTKQRSTILVHRKSPLLIATPPAVTRALAFSHAFLLPLNQAVGLVTWTSGDPWQSFLLVAGFWAITLYGDIAVRYAGPIMVIIGLIFGMYSRRYSPLSSSGWTGEKLQDQKNDNSEGGMKHQKSLDEIVETLNVFTFRCNILLEPFMQLTDFLSTQRTATSATTRPALTSLFIRILFVTPVWIFLTFPPFYLLTTRRVILAAGTVIFSWHSRPARVTRTLLWRSKLIRRISSSITGLHFTTSEKLADENTDQAPALPPRNRGQRDVAASVTSTGEAPSVGVRFTFVVYENQRRWLGLGWTCSLLAYERGPWTDEHLNPSASVDDYQLPEVDNGTATWRWVPGSTWQVDVGGKSKATTAADGWIYYDNRVSPISDQYKYLTLLILKKWNDGRRGQDGWGRYTRRRKWYRDAELVEIGREHDLDGSKHTSRPPVLDSQPTDTSTHTLTPTNDGDESSGNQAKRRGLFRRRRSSGRSGHSSSDFSGTATLRNDEDDAHIVPPHHERDGDWEVGDDVKMGLG